MQKLAPISLSVVACVLVALAILYVADPAPAQSAGDGWEYVIVNNQSKDRSLEIARAYAQQDERIRVHDNTSP